MSSIAICLVLIAGGKLAGLSMPISNIKNFTSTKSNADETSSRDINRLQNTDTTTYIYDINDLVAFRNSVNAGNSYKGKTVYVMADIDMSTVCSKSKGSWTPIGATGTVFAGTFDGDYHKISNLYIHSERYTTLGLFDALAGSGIVQNLIIENVDIDVCFTSNSNTFIECRRNSTEVLKVQYKIVVRMVVV